MTIILILILILILISLIVKCHLKADKKKDNIEFAAGIKLMFSNEKFSMFKGTLFNFKHTLNRNQNQVFLLAPFVLILAKS